MSAATPGPVTDSLQMIARDAASYAEGAGEPEFSQFLRIEARLLAMIRVKASLEPCINLLADALEAAKSIMWMAERYAQGGGSRSIEAEQYEAAAATISAALLAAGRLP